MGDSCGLMRVRLGGVLCVRKLGSCVGVCARSRPGPVLSLVDVGSVRRLLPPAHFVQMRHSFVIRGSGVQVVSHNQVIFSGACVPVDSDCGRIFRAFLSREDWRVAYLSMGYSRLSVLVYGVTSGCVSLSQAREDYRALEVR